MYRLSYCFRVIFELLDSEEMDEEENEGNEGREKAQELSTPVRRRVLRQLVLNYLRERTSEVGTLAEQARCFYLALWGNQCALMDTEERQYLNSQWLQSEGARTAQPLPVLTPSGTNQVRTCFLTYYSVLAFV